MNKYIFTKGFWMLLDKCRLFTVSPAFFFFFVNLSNRKPSFQNKGFGYYDLSKPVSVYNLVRYLQNSFTDQTPVMRQYWTKNFKMTE